MFKLPALLSKKLPSCYSKAFLQFPMRGYEDSTVLSKRDTREYFADPNVVADQLSRMIALHDNINDPRNITLGATWEELGLNELDKVEIFLQSEKEFDIWIPEEDCERFLTVNDLNEWICRNFYTKHI